MRNEKSAPDDKLLKNMTPDELNKRIDASESDFDNNRFKSSAELLAKFE
ncbi:MAG: hypothetical protein ACK4UK_01040 [Flavobacterium sp.]